LGYSPEICSYLTADIGAFVQGITPLSKAFKGIERVPRPDVLVYNTNQCRDVQDWFEWYAKKFNVPVLGVSGNRSVNDSKSSIVSSVARQIEEIVPPLERISGQKFDIDRLREIVALSRECSDLWKEVLATASARPSPLTFYDGCTLMGPAVVGRGTEAANDLYKKLLAEGIVPTDTAQKTIPAETLFVSGKAAMYPMGGFESATVVADAEENGINIGFCSMPSDVSGKEINVQYATGWAITKSCKNPEAAWQFLKETSFANDDMGKINARVGIPANRKIAETYFAKLSVGAVKFTNDYYVKHIGKAYMNPFGGTLASSGTVWTTMVQAVTLDNQDPQATVDKYAPQIAKEFAGYIFNDKK